MKHPVIQMMIDAGVGSNTLCMECRKNMVPMTNALGPWILCEPELSSRSVLFVGKVARGEELGEEIADSLEDVSPFGTEFIAESSWPYWAYTRETIETVYGDLTKGIPNISFTNIVKCNNETTQDTTDGKVKDFCINENGFIWREIEVLKPLLVVFYTGTNYDDYIDEFMPSYATTFFDNEDTDVEIGEKTMPWWDRSFFNVSGNEVLRFLRVGHPERKLKEDFVSMISSWILTNKECQSVSTIRKGIEEKIQDA